MHWPVLQVTGYFNIRESVVKVCHPQSPVGLHAVLGVKPITHCRANGRILAPNHIVTHGVGRYGPVGGGTEDLDR